MRVRPLRPIVVVVCTGVLLWQAAVSTGALHFCCCSLSGGNCCGAETAEERPACCCAGPAEKAERKRTCCGADRPGLTSCDCSARADDPPAADRPRPRVEPMALPASAWVEPPLAAAVDFRRPGAEPSAVWPPGVRPQSLLCAWLI